MSDDLEYCFYSGLPSPMAYMDQEIPKSNKPITVSNVNRIIEMAWEDRTPFEAIKQQFGLNESQVRSFMRKHLRSGSYIAWRKRVEASSLKHLNRRASREFRFKSTRQREISGNRISKRK